MSNRYLEIVLLTIMGLSLYGCQQGNPDPFFNNGVAYFQQGDTVKAVAEFNQAVKVKRNFAPGYYNLGICNLKPGAYNQAKQYFLKAIKYDPAYVDAYYSLSMVYVTLDSVPKAKDVLYLGIKRNPAASMLYYNLGYVLLLRGQTDSARWDFKKVTELDPQNSDAYFNLAYASNDPQYAREALDALRRAIEINGLNYKAHYLLGTKLANKNDRTDAEAKEAVKVLEIFMKSGKGAAAQIQTAKDALAKVKKK